MALADDRVGARHALCRTCIGAPRRSERSVIVFGAMEATLTPLMEAIEARFPGVKVFSLPSVDHPSGAATSSSASRATPAQLDAAYAALLDGLEAHGRRSSAPNWCGRRRAVGADDRAPTGARRLAIQIAGLAAEALQPGPARPVTGMLSATFLCAFSGPVAGRSRPHAAPTHHTPDAILPGDS